MLKHIAEFNLPNIIIINDGLESNCLITHFPILHTNNSLNVSKLRQFSLETFNKITNKLKSKIRNIILFSIYPFCSFYFEKKK